jgi:hypothetical protein
LKNIYFLLKSTIFVFFKQSNNIFENIWRKNEISKKGRLWDLLPVVVSFFLFFEMQLKNFKLYIRWMTVTKIMIQIRVENIKK